MKICQNNMRCRENPETCGYSIEVSSLESENYFVAGKCENEEKRKECVEVSRAVLCLEDNENENITTENN